MSQLTTNSAARPLRARFASLAAICATAMVFTPAFAAETAPVVQVAKTISTSAMFQKKTYGLKGFVTVEQRGEKTVLVFSDDFRTRKGPDLKVFLSKKSVASASGDNATVEAVRLGKLTSHKGQQDYILPAGITLSDYNSVLVHCEAFSKLWGGADLTW
jgi:hypothetical protein